jgi:cytochrome c1
MSGLNRGRAAALLAWLGATAGCAGAAPHAPIVPGGDPDRGRVAIARYGCGACHDIPGVSGARGLVGPPLGQMARRMYVAGVLPNEPENLVRWIRNPPGVDEKTAMPNMGVTDRDARDIAEYLYRLAGKG